MVYLFLAVLGIEPRPLHLVGIEFFVCFVFNDCFKSQSVVFPAHFLWVIDTHLLSKAGVSTLPCDPHGGSPSRHVLQLLAYDVFPTNLLVLQRFLEKVFSRVDSWLPKVLLLVDNKIRNRRSPAQCPFIQFLGMLPACKVLCTLQNHV